MLITERKRKQIIEKWRKRLTGMESKNNDKLFGLSITEGLVVGHWTVYLRFNLEARRPHVTQDGVITIVDQLAKVHEEAMFIDTHPYGYILYRD